MKHNQNTSKQCFDKHSDCEKQSANHQSTNGQSCPKNQPVIYQTSPEGLEFPKTDRASYDRITGKKAGASVNQAQYEQPRPDEPPVIYTILLDGVVIPKVDLAPYYLTPFERVKFSSKKTT